MTPCRSPLFAFALLLMPAVMHSPVSAAQHPDSSPVRHYAFYDPKVEQHYLYEDGPDSPYAYGHMVSIAYFDGRFHAVWNNSHGGHATRYFKEQGRPQPFQRLLWQTSEDARAWSEPIRITETHTETPLDTWDQPHTHWQPNLLNYHDRELWCLWSIGEGAYFDLPEGVRPVDDRATSLAGTYLSVLGRGPDAKWTHRRIFTQVEVPAPGSRTPLAVGYLFPSQNPILLKSGRVIQPVTLVVGDHRNMGTLLADAFFSAAIYTDDDGETWNISNLVSNADNPGAQWEPHIAETHDGKLRMFIRDSGRKAIHGGRELAYRFTLRHPLFLTTTGTGVNKGEPVMFDPDPRRVWIETEESRMHQIELPGGRYCMFHHDVWNANNVGARSNLALFFSRTGGDDFVAGPGIAGRSNSAHYAQGLYHDGKIYVGYTRWNRDVRTLGSTSAVAGRGIAISIIDPAPDPDRYQVWPRDKDYFASATAEWRKNSTESVYQRPALVSVDGRQGIRFVDRATAGVEIDRVDFVAGDVLRVWFDVKIERQQTYGNLILCSFGDQNPIRIGLPGNRPGQLYAYGRNDWRRVGDFPVGVWTRITMEFGADEFSVTTETSPRVTFTNPVRRPNPRLYLGDGYELDPFESNRESQFLIDLGSLQTTVLSESLQPAFVP